MALKTKGGVTVRCPSCGERVKPDVKVVHIRNEFGEADARAKVCPKCGGIIDVFKEDLFFRPNGCGAPRRSRRPNGLRRGGGKGSYDRTAALERVYNTLNAVKMPFLKAARRIRRVSEMYYRMRRTPIRFNESNDKRVSTILLETPASPKNAAAWTFYMSGQTSCPIYPAQLPAKFRRIKKEINRFPFCNRAIIFIAPKFTCGAREMLRKAGILAFTKASEALAFIARYFKARYSSLLASLKGKRLFGPLALLVYILQELLRELGGLQGEPLLRSEIEAYHAIENGITVQ